MPTVRLDHLLALTVLFAAAPAAADDGSWNNSYSLSEGPLYAVGDNPDVALDQELLVLEDYLDGSVTALFQFRNTSDRAVTVEAGFPVELDLSLEQTHEKDGRLAYQEGWGQPAWIITTDHHGGAPDPKLLALTGMKVRTGRLLDGDDEARYIRGADFAKRRVEKAVPKRPPFSFAIEQDGKPVALSSMVVELDPTATPEIVFHFRHRLVLGPKATSVVRVRYKAPTLSGMDGGMGPSYAQKYSWRYVLRTGATWKGPIGRLVLAVPRDGRCANQAAWRALGTWGGYDILERKAFEPGKADDIACDWQRGADEPSYWGSYWFGGFNEDDKPAPWAEARHTPPHVRGVRASSQVGYKAEVYSERGVITGAPNIAEAAFDGLLETAWSEGAKGDVGEYLELELTKPATGLRLMSGFLGTLHPFTNEKAGKKKEALYANLYAYNARPTKLELVAVDGTRRWELPVQDKKAQWNVYPILVPAGTYRLVIRATAKGKKWQDASIGEVDFVTGETAWLEALRQDPFYAPFFVDGAPYLQPWASE